MKNIIIENITLEQSHTSQASQLFLAIDKNREHLSAFLPWVGKMQHVSDMEEYLRNAEVLCEDLKESSFALIINNTAVGRIGLHHLNMQNKSGAIGYWLSKEAEGKGIIQRSCKALIRHGFEDLGLQRIEIKAAVANLKSRTVAERLNFVMEGTLRQAEFVNGQFLDLVLYSMIKDEWLAMNG